MKLSASSFRKTGYVFIHSAAAYNQLITGAVFNLLHVTSISSSQSPCCSQTLKWFSSLLQSAVISGVHAASHLLPIHLRSSHPEPGELIQKPPHTSSSSHLLIKSRSSSSSPVSRTRGVPYMLTAAFHPLDIRFQDRGLIAKDLTFIIWQGQ